MKGQISIEYMGVMVVSIILLIVIFSITNDAIDDRRRSSALLQSQISMNDLSSAINFLCSRPEDSVVFVRARIPSVVTNDSAVGNRSIFFSLSGGDGAYSNVDCEINGSLPGSPGTYRFKLLKTEDNVNVSYLTSR